MPLHCHNRFCRMTTQQMAFLDHTPFRNTDKQRFFFWSECAASCNPGNKLSFLGQSIQLIYIYIYIYISQLHRSVCDSIVLLMGTFQIAVQIHTYIHTYIYMYVYDLYCNLKCALSNTKLKPKRSFRDTLSICLTGYAVQLSTYASLIQNSNQTDRLETPCVSAQLDMQCNFVLTHC
jgi:hypothetical protein